MKKKRKINKKKTNKITKLNIGSCADYREDCINLDINKQYNPDVIWDLTKFPYPFKDDTFTGVIVHDILEHMQKPVEILEELYRICKDGAEIEIMVPHWSHYTAWTDLTHYREFCIKSFDGWEREKGGKYGYYSNKANFSIPKKEYQFTTNVTWRRRLANRIMNPILNKIPHGITELLICKYIPIMKLIIVLKVEKKEKQITLKRENQVTSRRKE
jgi:SAM-dependent methyltransferase